MLRARDGNNPMSTQTLFLIGCGFTTAAFPNAPSNNRLLDKLIESGQSPTLEKYCSLYKLGTDSSIEQLLTLADLNQPAKKNYVEDRTKINDEIATFFRRFRYPKCDDNSKRWLGNFARMLSADDCIVSLNYDALLEGALDASRVWHPKGGTGQVKNWFIENGDYPENPSGIQVLKVHGSEYFLECDIWGDDRDRTTISLSADPTIFPVSAEHSDLKETGTRRTEPYIVAPSFVKIWHFQIALMMLDALEAARQAERLVIIGCSMRPEDSFIWLLLTRYVDGLKDGHRPRVVIVDPNNAESLRDQILRYAPLDDDCVFAMTEGIESSIEQLRLLL